MTRRPAWLAATSSCLALLTSAALAQVPDLPDGARTHWVVAEPEEVVAYLAFDPATVRDRLPPRLRFITLEELAAGSVHWAKDYLFRNPAKAQWGVSFLEIVRAKAFSIDGRDPDWPEHGAAALWLARVAASDPTTDLGPGRPFLALDFWIPDRKYVAYLLQTGYYAKYGDVRLRQGPKGNWLGSVSVDGLSVAAACTPTGPVTGGVGSAGTQVIFPPRSSSATDIVRVAFAGHREQACEDGSSWTLHGTHPLVSGVVLGPPSFQFGYNLVGGTYPH